MCPLEGGEQLMSIYLGSLWRAFGGPKGVVTAQGGIIPPQEARASLKELAEQCLPSVADLPLPCLT